MAFEYTRCRIFRGADCDGSRSFERLAVCKQAAQKVEVGRFNFRQKSEMEIRKQYQIEITKRFAALGNLRDSWDIDRAWENIEEDITTSIGESIGLCELKQHRPCFDEECLRVFDQMKQAKMQWVHDPNQSNVDNLNNVRREASRHFRNKKKEYLQATIDEF